MKSESEPQAHELRVDATCAYLLYEVTPENFEATCRELSRRDGDNHIASLVISHMPLSATESASFPADVPWLVLDRSPADMHQALRESLVDPLLHPSPISVDFVDFANVLSHGGQTLAWSARGLNETECIAHLIDAMPYRRKAAAACLHIRCLTWFNSSNLDKICASISV